MDLPSTSLDAWVVEILADPRSKQPVPPSSFGRIAGRIDARVYLPNTYGFADWLDGQTEYEDWATTGGAGGDASPATYAREIEGDRPIYEHIKMTGRILDVGGGIGIVREHLPTDVKYVSVDPFIDCLDRIPPRKLQSYKCLSLPLNFVAACAEFLPCRSGVFDWVHMRSMIDHVKVPDLAMIEAHRVLKTGGRIVIGLYVDGGRSGKVSFLRRLRTAVRKFLGVLGIKRFQDHHIWHPTYVELEKLISDNGFTIMDVYWQPAHNDMVVYITGIKAE